jgi:hypothetical protein
MAYKLLNRALETSSTTGTGDYTLSGAVTGFQTVLAAGAVNADTVPYYAEDVDANGVPIGGWELGIGTWNTGGTLTRTTIDASSNAGAAVNWSAGTRRVAVGTTVRAVQSSGINIEVLSSGTSWTCPAGIYKVKIRGVGGGGSGGRAVSSIPSCSGAGGGYFEAVVAVAPGTAYTYAIGAGGGAATVNGTAGTAGGNTTFNDGVTTYTGNGGSAGLATPANSSTTPLVVGGTATNGSINVRGGPGYTVGGTLNISVAQGGSTPLGMGGVLGQAVNAQSASGYGAGGYGAPGNTNSNAGTQGVLILEY